MKKLILALVLFPSISFAQTQVTQEDLLKLIGFKEVQNFQCGKTLETAQEELKKLEEKEVVKEKK